MSVDPRLRVVSAVRTILASASASADFRQRCLEDPAAVLRDYAGMEMSRGYTVRFVEPDTPQIAGTNEVLIALPELREDGDEITDPAVLEAVGGAAKAPSNDIYGYP